MHEPRYHVHDVDNGGWDRCYGYACPYCRVGGTALKAHHTIAYIKDGKPTYVTVADVVSGITSPRDELSPALGPALDAVP